MSPLRRKFTPSIYLRIGCTECLPIQYFPFEVLCLEMCWTSGLECFEYRDDGASVLNWMAYSEDVHVPPCEEAGP